MIHNYHHYPVLFGAGGALYLALGRAESVEIVISSTKILIKDLVVLVRSWLLSLVFHVKWVECQTNFKTFHTFKGRNFCSKKFEFFTFSYCFLSRMFVFPKLQKILNSRNGILRDAMHYFLSIGKVCHKVLRKKMSFAKVSFTLFFLYKNT